MAIQRLSEDVINKIAAGEVVQRPSNAIKELIENSIDAEATALSITIAEGGLRELTVIDNGKGILVQDFPLLCERFATSKIRSMDDLAHIGSFGFRGQALASLSYVSEVKVTSKTKDKEQAYTASFKDSKMIGQPQPHYLNCGTVITCQNLFNCLQVRKESLKPSDEKRRIIKLINIFSLHYSWVRFKLVCDSKVEVNTEAIAGSNPQVQLHIFSKINELPLDSFVKAKVVLDDIEVACIMTKLKMAKSKAISLIVNNRIVEIPQLYTAVDESYCNLYNSIHYSDVTYNVYLSIKMDPKYIDCNVHPTKKTVNIINCSIFCKQLTQWILGVLKKQCKITPFTATVQQTLVFQQKKQTTSKGSVGARNDVRARVDAKQMPLRYYLPESNRGNQGEGKYVKKIQEEDSHIVEEQNPDQQEDSQPRRKNDNLVSLHIKIEQEELNQLPFELSTKVSQPCPKTKDFFRNLICVSYLNTQYMLIQLGTSLKILNLVPFMPSILITWLSREKKLLMKRLKEFNILKYLQIFTRQTNLKFDQFQYSRVLVQNRQLILQILRVRISSNGLVEYIPAPMESVKDKFIPKQISYLLARTAKSLLNNNIPDEIKLHRYLIQYFASLFEEPFDHYDPANRKYESFSQNKLIPLMKDKGQFESVDFNRYTAQMLNLKTAYKVFERC